MCKYRQNNNNNELNELIMNVNADESANVTNVYTQPGLTQ